MATTTNYGWETPDDTDLVKDGALAQRTTASAIDSSLFSITNGKNVGLVHINTTSFNGVSSISINNVFTSSFDAYKINTRFTSATGTDAALTFRLRSSGTDATTNYSQQRTITFGTTVVASQDVTGTDDWTMSFVTANYPSSYVSDLTVFDPAKTVATTGQNLINTRANAGTIYNENHSFYNFNTTAYDGFTLLSAGTITGTIKIYGYRNS